MKTYFVWESNCSPIHHADLFRRMGKKTGVWKKVDCHLFSEVDNNEMTCIQKRKFVVGEGEEVVGRFKAHNRRDAWRRWENSR